MRAPGLLTALAVAITPTLPLAAGYGQVESGGVRVELLPGEVRTGETVRRPEGWYRVDGPEEPGPAGSFAVVPSGEPAPLPGEPGEGTRPPAGEGPAEVPLPRSQRSMGLCEPERAAFLKELFRIAGVEVADPLALVAAFTGENAGEVPSLRFPEWGLVPVDPVRALAWNFELQIRARELSQCVRDPSRPRLDPRFHARGAVASATGTGYSSSLFRRTD